MQEDPHPSSVQRWADQALEAVLLFCVMTAMGAVVALFVALALWMALDLPVSLGLFFKAASLGVALCLIAAMGWWKHLPPLLLVGAMGLCGLCLFLDLYLYFWPAALLAPLPRRMRD